MHPTKIPCLDSNLRRSNDARYCYPTSNVAQFHTLEAQVPLTMIETSNFAFSSAIGDNTGYGLIQNSSSGYCVVSVPHIGDPGASLIALRMVVRGKVSGGSSHSGMPANKPALSLVRAVPQTGSEEISVITDPTSDVSAYDGVHTVSTPFVTAAAITGRHLNPGEDGAFFVAAASERYYARIQGESGANAQANSFHVLGLIAVWRWRWDGHL